MDIRRHKAALVFSSLAFLLAVVAPMTLQATSGMAKLRVIVRPVETDVFIDGEHMGDATYDGTLQVPNLSPGEHTVELRCYGYTPQSFKLNFEAGRSQYIETRLEPLAGTVAGPWGRIQIKGSSHAAVLLNGKTPEYMVGHVDETNNSFITQQELLVHPGTYQVAVVHKDKTIWAGPVTVEAGKRTVLHVPSGTTHVENWAGKQPANDLPRFHGGIFSDTIAVGPVTGTFSAGTPTIACGDSAQLTWNTSGAVHTELSSVGRVAASGTQQVTPTATTTYTLTATGPGGAATPTATVTVDNHIDASLTVSPAEVTYERVGNKVAQQGTATVTWSATDGHPLTVNVDPYGSVDATGNRQVTPEPSNMTNGPVDQTFTYTLHATNPCGGDVTRTATLHMTGAIRPGAATETFSEFTETSFVSIFFPTAWPMKDHSDGGLLKSQQEALMSTVKAFKDFQQQDPNARIVLESHADIRGGVSHNQELTDRRAARVKEFLVAQGIPASVIDVQAVGQESQLGKDEVKDLEAKNPHTPPKDRVKKADETWMAYNRRVDILVQPLGIHSTRTYPHDAPDSSILWAAHSPTWKVVQKNQ